MGSIALPPFAGLIRPKVAAAGGITLVEAGHVDMVVNSGVFTFVETLQEDDIVIVHIAADSSGIGAPTPATYTKRFDNGSFGIAAECWYKFMGATPDTTMTLAGSGNKETAIVTVWRGVDTTTPFDVSDTSANSGSGLPNSPSLTTVTAGAMRVISGFLDDDLAVFTAPSGYTLADTWNLDESIYRQSVCVAYAPAPTAGADNPAVFGADTGNDSWYAYHQALRPA